MLTEADIKPESVYMTTLIKCYGGREPHFSEYAAFKRCRYHTLDLIKIIQPRAIVLCGMKPFIWLISRYTSLKIDETNFYKWMGKIVRLKEVWGDRKFFITESPAMLARHRHLDNERKCIEMLQSMKAYVMAQQKNESAVILDMVDLNRRRPNTAQMKFNWT